MRFLIFFLLAVSSIAQDIVKIQVQFKMTDGVYTLVDSLYFTEAEYKALTKEALTALQQERFDAYVASMEAAKVVVEPTVADLEKQLQEITDQITVLQKQYAETEAQLVKATEAAAKEPKVVK
jgi:predicted  nucleic acid-binding Zn-ribbon protein